MSESHFSIDTLVEDLKRAAGGSDPQAAVRAIMDRSFADHGRMLETMPEYVEDDVILFENDSVSIWHCRFQPGKPVPPHNHEISATIGLYQGVERNAFFKAAPEGGIRHSSDVDMTPGTVLSIGPSGIHSVECISDGPSCGIHVYLGPLTKIERDLYDLSTGEKMPFTDQNYERLKSQTA